jgi:hypothetical protein
MSTNTTNTTWVFKRRYIKVSNLSCVLTEKSLSRGQRRDKKLVDELPPLLETVTFPWEDWVDGSLVLGSVSADFA